MVNHMIKNPPFPKNYAAEMLILDRGKGCMLYDVSGKQYYDFGSGIAVNALGHGRADLAEIAAAQMKKLTHTSNLYTTAPALELAGKMTAGSSYCAVHFGNSGAEAVEAAIKYARLYAYRTKGKGNHKLLCFKNGFHGRTLGALSVTTNRKYQGAFQPLLEGVATIDLNDAAALEKNLDASFAAVILEVLQGEGGLDAVTPEFAGLLNTLCKKHDVILIADEIQTGLSRLGSFYGHTLCGLKPDIIALAKPLAGGLPLSATLIPEKINTLLEVGEHGSTFGGGPVTTAVASHVWDLLADESLIKDVVSKGEYLKTLLDKLKVEFPFLGEIKGRGLLAGIEVNISPDQFPGIIKKCMDEGLLILRSGSNVLRIAPPLIIKNEELEQGIKLLQKVLKTV